VVSRQLLEARAAGLPPAGPRPLPFTCLPIQDSQIVPPYDALFCEFSCYTPAISVADQFRLFQTPLLVPPGTFWKWLGSPEHATGTAWLYLTGQISYWLVFWYHAKHLGANTNNYVYPNCAPSSLL